MAENFTIAFDFSGVEAALDGMAQGSQEALRPAAQAGAQVLYDEVLVRVPVAKRERKLKSGRIIAPGALRAAIYQVYSKDRSTKDRAVYHVSWNAKKAPHGHLVERGTSRAPAHPFLRPSFDARAKDALQAARTEWINRMRPRVTGSK